MPGRVMRGEAQMDRHTRVWRLLAPLLLAATVALAGCGGDDGDGGTTQPPAAPPTAQPDTSGPSSPGNSSRDTPPSPGATVVPRPGGSTWSSEPVRVEREVAQSARLVGIRSAHHADEAAEGGISYDRLVLEFSTDLPGYTAEYVDELLGPGSGAPFPLRGQALFEVVLNPAAAHDDEGQPTLRTPSSGGGHPAIVSYEMTGDFEGYVHIGIGLDDVVGFRVIELANPARLVIDFQA